MDKVMEIDDSQIFGRISEYLAYVNRMGIGRDRIDRAF